MLKNARRVKRKLLSCGGKKKGTSRLCPEIATALIAVDDVIEYIYSCVASAGRNSLGYHWTRWDSMRKALKHRQHILGG